MKKTTTIILIILALVSFGKETSAQVLEADSLALVDFYNASGGDWDNTNTWLVDSVSKWSGVVVTGDRVTELSIEGFFPSGTISPSLGNLSALKVLKLIGLEDGPVIIDLHGSIPSEIWNLTNLEKLQIKFTNVTGGIPAGIESMTSLQEINFQQTKLGGKIPYELFQLPSLIKAYLHQSDFTDTVPSSVTGASQLTRLYLHDNKLEGPLPFVDIRPENSAKVNLTGNYFTFQDVKEYHDSAANYTLTDEYQYAKVTDTVYVTKGSKDTLTGDVPDGESYAWFKDEETIPVGTDDSLEVTVGSFSEEGTYTCKAQSSLVSGLDIRTVYEVFMDISDWERDSLALVDFYIGSGGDWDTSNTWLEGPVSTWPGVVVSGGRVTELSTEGSFPSDTISPSIGQLSALVSLKLIGLEDGPVILDLHGSIPEEIWNLTNLEKLQIKFTNVTGGIPAGIESMTSLQEINFQQTKLGGKIPYELFQLPSLIKAYLHQSDFTDTVPSSVTGATQLTRLYLHDNKLEGPLPFVDIPAENSAKVNLTGNYFTFEDVKPYHDSSANYTLTDEYQLAQDTMVYTDVDEESSLTFNLYVKDGESYAWFKNEETTPLSTDTSYTISSVVPADTGLYTCKVQNSAISDFYISAAFIIDNVIPKVVPPLPVLSSASTSEDGTKIYLDFDLNMADASGETANFAVSVNDAAVTVSSSATDGTDASIVVLTLASAVPDGSATVTVSYTPGTLQSTEGGLVAAFGPTSVTNNVPTTGIDDTEINFSVFPNPFSESLQINSTQQVNFVRIADITGNTVFEMNTASVNTLSIPLDELCSGIYFITVKTNSSSSTLRIIKK